MKKLLVVLLVSMSLGVSIPLCFPDIAQSWEEGLDGEYGGDTSSGGTGTSSGNDDTCSGGGSATGGCDGGGGNTGPSPEEVADEGAAGYEQEAAGLSVNALSANTSLRGWDDYFNESRSTYDGLADSVFGSADRIGGYGARAEDDWQGARSYLSEFDAFELQQLETPSQLLSEIDEIIEKLQGPRLNDPVIVASGIETFTAVDAKYEALLGEIAIKRTYRSTHNAPKSSFGSGWFFNYDTNIVVGRKPLIKEKELLASDLSVKMIDLQADIAETLDLSLAESANAGIALDTAIAELTNMQQASEQYASIIPLIEEYLAGAQSAANAAEELRSQGTEAAGASADQAWGHVTQIQAILDFAIERRQAMESVLVAAEQKLAATKDAANSQIPGVVEQISQYKTEIAAMTTDITERKAKAVAEARAEELRFPNDPYPADPSVYFGAGYIKVIDEEGSPILYRIGEDGQYHPISDHGSDTSVLRETETAYQRVDKHGRITEFAKTGTGRATLTVTRDTNGNETLFTRLGNILTVTDPVERVTTVTYTPEGFISTVVDPQGRTHSYSYQGGQLVGYTDPVGNTWRYGYDGENRLISRTDPLSHVYRYTYDGLGRVLSEIDEAGFAIDYSYDPENRVTTVTDRRGFARQYHYNEAQRVETIVHPDGSSVSFTYDEKNNIASTTNENGATTFFTYTPLTIYSRLPTSSAMSPVTPMNHRLTRWRP